MYLRIDVEKCLVCCCLRFQHPPHPPSPVYEAFVLFWRRICHYWCFFVARPSLFFHFETRVLRKYRVHTSPFRLRKFFRLFTVSFLWVEFLHRDPFIHERWPLCRVNLGYNRQRLVLGFKHPHVIVTRDIKDTSRTQLGVDAVETDAYCSSSSVHTSLRCVRRSSKHRTFVSPFFAAENQSSRASQTPPAALCTSPRPR